MEDSTYDIRRIAELARLDLTEAERAKYGSQLTTILDYVGKLESVPTEAVPPADHATGNTNVTRPDTVEPSAAELIVRSAPGGGFRIPSVRSLWTS